MTIRVTFLFTSELSGRKARQPFQAASDMNKEYLSTPGPSRYRFQSDVWSHSKGGQGQIGSSP